MSEIPYLDPLRRELLAAANRRRARLRKRRLVVAAASTVLGLLAVAGVAASDLRWPLPDDLRPGVEPVQRGQTSSVATGTVHGKRWVLTARKTNQGLCVGIQYGAGWGEGCGFPPVEERPVQLQTASGENTMFVYGQVHEKVDRVKIQLSDGTSVMEETLQQGGYDVRFYVHAVENRGHVKRVVGYDGQANVVGVAG